MERDEDPAAASRRSSADSAGRVEDVAQPHTPHALPDEQKKQKKHGRVHKREKELYGLVTPVFLPLLDARESTSPEKKESRARPENAESSKEARKPPKENKDPGSDMAGETPVKERSVSDPVKKSRRSSIKKKSALRHSSTPRNRKRVSLVIDDQVVLPSDMIQEPALTSPSSETTSATASTASLDEMIDPRLTSPDAPVYIEHHDAVHHSMPLTMQQQPKTSPIKASAPPFSNPNSNPPPVMTEATHSPPTSPSIRSPTTPFAPPSYATRSFLDPPPERMHIEDIPVIAGPEPIFPDETDVEDQMLASTVAADENFQTYVGGISGSGVDDVNQVGSVGYPSSLGASYLESYMQGRPLSVRMVAAEREGDEGEVRRLRGLEERRRKREADEKREKEKEKIEDDDDWDLEGGHADGKDVGDDDFMGSMDDF